GKGWRPRPFQAGAAAVPGERPTPRTIPTGGGAPAPPTSENIEVLSAVASACVPPTSRTKESVADATIWPSENTSPERALIWLPPSATRSGPWSPAGAGVTPAGAPGRDQFTDGPRVATGSRALVL